MLLHGRVCRLGNILTTQQIHEQIMRNLKKNIIDIKLTEAIFHDHCMPMASVILADFWWKFLATNQCSKFNA
jgi:hypothetical protein